MIDFPDKEALIWNDRVFFFSDLYKQFLICKKLIDSKKIANRIVAIESESSPYSIAMLLTLIEKNNIVLPLSPFMYAKKAEFYDTAEVEFIVKIDNGDYNLEVFSDSKPTNTKLQDLILAGRSGLILFSSGTTGKSKAILHDLEKFIQKFNKPGKDLSTIAFMQYDHVGGVDTLFYAMSKGSLVYLPHDRNPRSILRAIEKYKLQVLPTTPSFLNLMMLSRDYLQFDLSSLKYITFGTEVMPEWLLKKCEETFPQIKIIQKYGTTELGSPKSKSNNENALWLKIEDNDLHTRVIDGVLQIKSDTTMIGYLNAPDPFTEDGWYITGDRVEVKEGYIRFMGRESDIINVGGEKVFPAEVENTIMELEEVIDVTVYGERNNIIGNIVCANVTVSQDINEFDTIRKKIREHCSSRLQQYKIPMKYKFTHNNQITDRFKKSRIPNA